MRVPVFDVSTLGLEYLSNATLLEGENSLSPGYSTEQSTIDIGLGRFTHINGGLIFSSSDNSDPRVNGRTYRIIAENGSFSIIGIVLLLVACGACLWPMLTLAGMPEVHERNIRALGLLAGGAGLLTAAILVYQLLRGPLGAPGDTQALRYIDIPLWVGGVLLGGSVGHSIGGREGARRGVFLGMMFVMLAVFNIMFFGFEPFWIIFDPDSDSYMEINPCRSPGYYLFTQLFISPDTRWIVIVQFNLIIVSIFIISYSIVRVTSYYLAGIATMFLGFVFATQTFRLAFSFRPDALFAAAFILIIAGAILYIADRRLWQAALTGIAISVALAVKSAAPVLLLPAGFLLLLSAPGKYYKALALLGLPIMCLLGQMLHGRLSHGAWSPTLFMGANLSGNVATGIHASPPGQHPKLSGVIEEHIKPIYSKWPPFSWANATEYAETSRKDYNLILYSNILPDAEKYLKEIYGKIYSVCSIPFNSILIDISLDSIFLFPDLFMKHIVAHYIYMWYFSHAAIDLNELRLYIRRDMAYSYEIYDNTELAQKYYKLPDNEIIDFDALGNKKINNTKTSLLLYFIQKSTNLWWVLFLGAFCTICSFFIFALKSLSNISASIVILSALITTYYTTHVVFQVSLHRYVAPVQPLFAALSVLIIVSVAKQIIILFTSKESRKSALKRAHWNETNT